MMASRRWMWMTLFLTMVAGAALGVLGDRLTSSPERATEPRTRGDDGGTIWFPCDNRPDDQPAAASENPGRRERGLERMREDLGLDDAQVEQLRAAFRRHGDAAHDFWLLTRDRYCAMRGELRQDVRSLLTAEQLPRFEERVKRWNEREAGDRSEGGGRGSDREHKNPKPGGAVP